MIWFPPENNELASSRMKSFSRTFIQPNDQKARQNFANNYFKFLHSFISENLKDYPSWSLIMRKFILLFQRNCSFKHCFKIENLGIQIWMYFASYVDFMSTSLILFSKEQMKQIHYLCENPKWGGEEAFKYIRNTVQMTKGNKCSRNYIIRNNRTYFRIWTLCWLLEQFQDLQ